MIRTTEPLQLHIMRHAEAYKNLTNVHGGGDQRLTEQGIDQAVRIGRFLQQHCDFQPETGAIMHQPEGRSAETARIIGNVTTASVRMIPDLKGVSMGIIAGLPEPELEILYPQVAAQIRAWRVSRGVSTHPIIPGSESMPDFANRVRQGLEQSITGGAQLRSVGIVATTSTLTMLNHLLENDGDLREDAYEFTDPPLASVVTWRMSEEAPLRLSSAIVPD